MLCYVVVNVALPVVGQTLDQSRPMILVNMVAIALPLTLWVVEVVGDYQQPFVSLGNSDNRLEDATVEFARTVSHAGSCLKAWEEGCPKIAVDWEVPNDGSKSTGRMIVANHAELAAGGARNVK